tara:strand:- start:7160 stop:8101 length:942 start_codon:yes stop_codon:yes gene_type:complete
MFKKNNKLKYIIVLGTTFSGSSAVYDYLAGRGDLYNPLPEPKEYQLSQSPGGLMSLEAAAGNAFHHSIADHYLDQFWTLAKKLSHPTKRIDYGQGYSNYIPNFLTVIEKFLDEVTVARMPMELEWHKMFESNTQRLLRWLRARLDLKKIPEPTKILTSVDELVHAAQLMHDRLFYSSNHQPVLLNQAGSGWNPVESTKYFSNRKVVLVTRDPRDQFAELKQFKKASNVKEFIKWFDQLQKRISIIDEKIVLKISFEEFIENNSATINLICKHFDLDYSVKSSFQSNLSKKNIDKYRDWLTYSEITQIETFLGL